MYIEIFLCSSLCTHCVVSCRVFVILSFTYAHYQYIQRSTASHQSKNINLCGNKGVHAQPNGVGSHIYLLSLFSNRNIDKSYLVFVDVDVVFSLYDAQHTRLNHQVSSSEERDSGNTIPFSSLKFDFFHYIRGRTDKTRNLKNTEFIFAGTI